jgi:hypothetical protein
VLFLFCADSVYGQQFWKEIGFMEWTVEWVTTRSACGLLLVALSLLFAEGVAPAKPGAQPVVLPSVRIKLLVPPGWREVGSAEVISNRRRILLKDADLKKAVESRARLPQFAFTKHAEDYDSLNPAVQFVSRPAVDAMDALGVVQQTIDAMKSGLADFQVIEGPTSRQIAGRNAALARMRYKVGAPNGDSYAVESRVIVVLDGKELAIIGFTGTATGADRCEGEFQALLKSIQPM